MEPIFNKYTAKCLACHTGYCGRICRPSHPNFSAAQMKAYIESKFNHVMTWENHIGSCGRLCRRYSKIAASDFDLEPVWASDNVLKNGPYNLSISKL